MDTDDLSIEAYKAVIVEAERFNHDLTLQFGLLSSKCIDEQDYLDKSKKLIDRMKRLTEGEFFDMFFGNPPEKDDFYLALDKILENIDKVIQIPIDKRTLTYD
jgi:hypothetical protein